MNSSNDGCFMILIAFVILALFSISAALYAIAEAVR